MVVNNVAQNVYKAFKKMHIIGGRDSLSSKRRGTYLTTLNSVDDKLEVPFEDNLTSWQ
jgi:hypothetical protein